MILYFLSCMWKRCQICTQTQHTLISVSFAIVKFCNLRGEGRWGWQGRVRNGVRMKHIIALDKIEFRYKYPENKCRISFRKGDVSRDRNPPIDRNPVCYPREINAFICILNISKKCSLSLDNFILHICYYGKNKNKHPLIIKKKLLS